MPDRTGIAAAAAAMLLAAATAAWPRERAPATIPVGDLVLWFDAAIWRVEAAAQRYEFHAIDAHPDEPPVIIEVVDDGRPCTPQAMVEAAGLWHPDTWHEDVTTLARPGFDIHAATVELGCRNWTGSPVFACAAYRGKGYFLTANPGGCQETPPRYHEPVFDLLMGLEAP